MVRRGDVIWRSVRWALMTAGMVITFVSAAGTATAEEEEELNGEWVFSCWFSPVEFMRTVGKFS